MTQKKKKKKRKKKKEGKKREREREKKKRELNVRICVEDQVCKVAQSRLDHFVVSYQLRLGRG